MRHLWSLLAGVVAAPLVWVLLAASQHRSQALVTGWLADREFDTGPLAGPVAYLVVAGIVLGVLGTLRWSPLGPLAAGTLLAIPTVLMFINPLRTMSAFLYADQPRQVLWLRLEPWLPVQNGTMLVLGTLLLMAVFSVQRWRNWPTLPTPVPYPTDDEVVAGITALTSTSSQSESQSESESESQSQSASTPSATPLTDDEILAAAAAYEPAESSPGAGTLEEAAGPPDLGSQPDPDR